MFRADFLDNEESAKRKNKRQPMRLYAKISWRRDLSKAPLSSTGSFQIRRYRRRDLSKATVIVDEIFPDPPLTSTSFQSHR